MKDYSYTQAMNKMKKIAKGDFFSMMTETTFERTTTGLEKDRKVTYDRSVYHNGAQRWYYSNTWKGAIEQLEKALEENK